MREETPVKGVSVIICCYNSVGRISETVQYLAYQRFSKPVNWEFILVDNCCTDATVESAESVWADSGEPCEMRVVREDKPGLCWARLAGVHEARYEYLLFCDDDNWLSADYLETAFDFMDSMPHVGVLGGASEAVSRLSIPDWFEEVGLCYAVGTQAEESGDVSARGYVWGAGSVLRRSVFLELLDCGFRFYNTGRSGTELLCGEDYEVCCWFRIAGYRLWYSDQLCLKHFMAPERLTLDYRKRLEEGIALANEVVRDYRYFISKQEWRFTMRAKQAKAAGYTVFYFLCHYFFILLNAERALRYARRYKSLRPFARLQSDEIFDQLLCAEARYYRKRGARL